MLVAVWIDPYRTLNASSINIRLAAQPSQMDGAAIKGPVEEFGRRGVALPLLQRRLALIGGTDSWRHLGLVALFGFPVERDAAKRVVIHFFYWFDCRQRDRDAIIQRIAWQRPAPRIV